MISTATRKPRIRASILTAAAGVGLFALACDTPVPQSPSELERPSRSQAVVVPDVVDAPEVGLGVKVDVRSVEEDGTHLIHSGELAADPEAGFGYVDEDGTFQGFDLDPEGQARIRKTLERLELARSDFEITREKLEERLRSGEITKEDVPRDLWLKLESAMEHIERLTPRLDELTAEMAMEARRLQTAAEAGEITYEEWEEMLKTHMAAHKARLRLRDKPH